MAVYNEIQSGRFNRWFQKVTGIKGGAPVKQLGSEILPVLPIHHGIEERYLYSWGHFRQCITTGPNAAVNSGIRFRNPANSNVCCVFLYWLALKLGADLAGTLGIRRGQATTDLDTPLGFQPNEREDPRGIQQTSMVVSLNTVALTALTNPTLLFQVPCPAVNMVPFVWGGESWSMLLMPGDAIQFSEDLNQNARLIMNLYWRERFLEDSERT